MNAPESWLRFPAFSEGQKYPEELKARAVRLYRET